MSDPELYRLVADLFPELLSNIPTNSYVVPRNIMRDPTPSSPRIGDAGVMSRASGEPGSTEQSSSGSSLNMSQGNNGGGINNSLNHLESISYDVLNRRFVRSGDGGPIHSTGFRPSGPTNETRTRVPVQESPVLPSRQVTYPEFDQLMNLYHRNVFEYNRTTQSMVDAISSNQSRSVRDVREIGNISNAFNRNMQEYHQITDNCLDLLRDMYFSQTYVNASRSRTGTEGPLTELVVEGRMSSDQNSHNRYTNVNSRTNVGVNSHVTPSSNFIPITPTTTTISPPRTLFSYTLFPQVQGQRMEQSGQGQAPLLTAQQMRDATEEYTYASDTTLTVIPVCPITLEDFQEGDSITRIRECLHEFKTPHLNRWFLRSSRCPVCRWNLLSPTSVRSNRSRSNSQLNVHSTNHGPISMPLTTLSDPVGIGSNVDASSATLQDRLQEILTDPSLNQISQRLFSNIFQNMLMNSTDAPPNITSLIEGGSDTSMNFQSLFGNGTESLINSIDITYTIDYDSSSEAYT